MIVDLQLIVDMGSKYVKVVVCYAVVVVVILGKVKIMRSKPPVAAPATANSDRGQTDRLLLVPSNAMEAAGRH